MHGMRICPKRKGAEYRIKDFILFGKYRIVSVLGSGNFGTVYLAEHLKLKVYRAVKCIPKDKDGKFSFSFEEGFPREANLLKNLNHPGIPLIYDIDEDNDFYYMIEEFIQGESLDTFVLHQENISQELIIEFGIQLCEILDYLHHYAPYPILYQDLKPEHIILCGNQLKLIDFGIASFFTGSGKHFQKFGTKGFAAPEAIAGLPVTAASDLYSLGKILAFLAEHASPGCAHSLTDIISHAVCECAQERYQEATQLKSDLQQLQKISTGRFSSHPISNIAVIGSRTGAGSTHISVSLTCVLNRLHTPALYLAADGSRTLESCAAANRSMKEQNGLYTYGWFRGVPDYGTGVNFSLPSGHCIVRDYGTCSADNSVLAAADCILFVLSGSDWDIDRAILSGKSFLSFSQTIFVVNFQNKKAARQCAKILGRKVCCFPSDCDPYRVTAEKERLVRALLKKRGGFTHIRT